MTERPICCFLISYTRPQVIWTYFVQTYTCDLHLTINEQRLIYHIIMCLWLMSKWLLLLAIAFVVFSSSVFFFFNLVMPTVPLFRLFIFTAFNITRLSNFQWRCSLFTVGFSNVKRQSRFQIHNKFTLYIVHKP